MRTGIDTHLLSFAQATECGNKIPLVEWLVYAVIHIAHQFRAYFLAHPIKIFTEYSLVRYLRKPETSGSLTTWVIELSKFRIDYVPATTIKGQAVANFIVELT